MRVLNSRVFAGTGGALKDDMYNDVPVYDDRHEDVVWQGNTGSAYGEGVRSNRTGSVGANDYNNISSPTRASTWADTPYDRLDQNRARSSTIGDQSDYTYSDTKKGPPPGRPAAPKPTFGNKGAGNAGPGQAIAKFTFDADQPGDLGFKKGDIITIVKRTESENDWWTGRIGGKEGIFPSNYVEVV